MSGAPKLRLVKVAVQPVCPGAMVPVANWSGFSALDLPAVESIQVRPFFVLDDGETITELEHPATVIPASEWPTYSSERFPREVAEWQAKLDAETKPPPNRATRRRRA